MTDTHASSHPRCPTCSAAGSSACPLLLLKGLTEPSSCVLEYGVCMSGHAGLDRIHELTAKGPASTRHNPSTVHKLLVQSLAAYFTKLVSCACPTSCLGGSAAPQQLSRSTAQLAKGWSAVFVPCYTGYASAWVAAAAAAGQEAAVKRTISEHLEASGLAFVLSKAATALAARLKQLQRGPSLPGRQQRSSGPRSLLQQLSMTEALQVSKMLADLWVGLSDTLSLGPNDPQKPLLVKRIAASAGPVCELALAMASSTSDSAADEAAAGLPQNPQPATGGSSRANRAGSSSRTGSDRQPAASGLFTCQLVGPLDVARTVFDVGRLCAEVVNKTLGCSAAGISSVRSGSQLDAATCEQLFTSRSVRKVLYLLLAACAQMLHAKQDGASQAAASSTGRDSGSGSGSTRSSAASKQAQQSPVALHCPAYHGQMLQLLAPSLNQHPASSTQGLGEADVSAALAALVALEQAKDVSSLLSSGSAVTFHHTTGLHFPLALLVLELMVLQPQVDVLVNGLSLNPIAEFSASFSDPRTCMEVVEQQYSEQVNGLIEAQLHLLGPLLLQATRQGRRRSNSSSGSSSSSPAMLPGAATAKVLLAGFQRVLYCVMLMGHTEAGNRQLAEIFTKHPVASSTIWEATIRAHAPPPATATQAAAAAGRLGPAPHEVAVDNALSFTDKVAQALHAEVGQEPSGPGFKAVFGLLLSGLKVAGAAAHPPYSWRALDVSHNIAVNAWGFAGDDCCNRNRSIKGVAIEPGSASAACQYLLARSLQWVGAALDSALGSMDQRQHVSCAVAWPGLHFNTLMNPREDAAFLGRKAAYRLENSSTGFFDLAAELQHITGTPAAEVERLQQQVPEFQAAFATAKQLLDAGRLLAPADVAGVRGLARKLQQFALDVQAQLPVPWCCNNPLCLSLEKDSELELGKFCTGCKVAKYCCRQCQCAHWSTHKPVCKRLQAAAAAGPGTTAPGTAAPTGDHMVPCGN